MQRRNARKTRNRRRLSVAGSLVTAMTAGFIAGKLLPQRRTHPHPVDGAPGRTARHRQRFGDYAVVGRTVTINRPRPELYAFWRDFQNLPRFMENLDDVQPTGKDRAAWTICGPLGWRFNVETEVIEDRKDELIAWRSVAGSDIDTEGRIAFRDAAAGRGTEVEAIIAYKPPAGEAGRIIAKLFQREPNIQGRRELKRFKALMETGEIPTARNHQEPEG